MTAYYNEIAPFAAQYLRNLIDAGLSLPVLSILVPLRM